MKATAFIQSTAASLAIALSLWGCSESTNMSTAPDISSTSASLTKATSAVPILAEQHGNFLKAQLLPGPDGTNQRSFGTAIWEQRNKRIKFSVEVQNVFSSGGNVSSSDGHKVRVNGNGVGEVNVVRGRGGLEIDTETGHLVPTMKKDDVVEVLDPSGR